MLGGVNGKLGIAYIENRGAEISRKPEARYELWLVVCTGESHWYYFSAVMGLGMGLNLYVDQGRLGGIKNKSRRHGGCRFHASYHIQWVFGAAVQRALC